MVRSILAVVVGFVLIGALSVGADALVRQLAPGAYDGARMTSIPWLVVTQSYVAAFAIVGCYVCARLAPSRPMQHALVLGALGLVFNVAGSYARWSDLPTWYHVVALAMTMPYAYVGGWLRERELARQSPPHAAHAVA